MPSIRSRLRKPCGVLAKTSFQSRRSDRQYRIIWTPKTTRKIDNQTSELGANKNSSAARQNFFKQSGNGRSIWLRLKIKIVGAYKCIRFGATSRRLAGSRLADRAEHRPDGLRAWMLLPHPIGQHLNHHLAQLLVVGGADISEQGR